MRQIWVCLLAGLWPMAGALAALDPANHVYAGIYSEPVALRAGVYEGEPFIAGGAARRRVQLIEGLSVQADLNADGQTEQVVFLAESSGGSGEAIYLAVLGEQLSVTRLLGDRVKIRAVSAQDGELQLDLIIAGPQQPACCPTLKVRKSYRLVAGELVERETQQQGMMSLADLNGSQWQLARIDQAAVADGVTITACFTADKISGQSGCNRYFATVTDLGDMQLGIGTVAGTMMACAEPAMQWERRYLTALQQVDRFSFMAGQLWLAYRDQGHLGSLLLRRKP
jgi:heat shock protein HslJ